MIKPTYSAQEIKRLCTTIEVGYEGFKAIQEIIEEEIELYCEDDLIILCEASMIMFTRTMIYVSLRKL